MINLFRRDVILLKKKSFKIFTALAIVIPLFIVFFGKENIYLSLLFSMGYIMTILTADYGDIELNNHEAIGYLPISNKEIVLQKYLFLIINYILGIIYSFLIFYILKFFGWDFIGYIDFKSIYIVSFSLFLIGSITLPIFFWLTSKWYNAWSVGIIYFIIATSINLFFHENSLLIKFNLPTILIMTFTIYILSLISSIKIYKNRDIE